MADEIHTPRNQPTQLHPSVTAPSVEDIFQGETDEEFQNWADEAFNPVMMARGFEDLKTKMRRAGRKDETEKTEKGEEGELLVVKEIEAISEQFNRKNPELIARSLMLLRSRISQQDNQDDILRKVLEMYPDHSLADEALDYLLSTTKGDLTTQVRLAKEKLNNVYGREVRAGRNMAEQARE